LMAGGALTFDIDVPATLLRPSMDPEANDDVLTGKQVRLRPLAVKDIQLILKAAKGDEVLTSVLMIQQSLVEPHLKQSQIGDMQSGLVSFLVEQINRISGLSGDEGMLREIAASPLVQTFFVLAREFSWTPEQVREMTFGQVLGYLEMLNSTKGAATVA
jgi:hypothetical protein